MAKKLFSVILVIAFAFIAGLPLLHEGLIPTHDGEYHVIRFYEFDKALRDGNIYPRWAKDLNNGQGVPLFNFVYPLPNYVAFIFHAVGISFIDSFRFIMFGSFLLGALFFYLWAKRYWGELGGIVASVFYTFSPYHFVDTYIRGSVGEVMALAIFPGLLWSFDKFISAREKKFIILSAIFLALLIFAHNILALLFFTFFVFYAIFLLSRQKFPKHSILNTLYLVLIGLGLSAIFWLPALFEKKYVSGLQIFSLEDNFPEIYQLLIPSWGSGIFGDTKNEMSVQIGIANLLVVLVVVFFLSLPFLRKKIKRIPTILFFLTSFFIVTFMMLPASSFFWKSVPLFDYFQFPWRLLSLTILATSFLSGGIILIFKNKIKLLVASLMIAIVFFTTVQYTQPAYYHLRDDNYYVSRSNFIDGTNSPGNTFNTKWLSKIPPKRRRLEFENGTGSIEQTMSKTQKHSFIVKTQEKASLLLNIAYFPGWTIYINGKEMPTEEKKGLISIAVPQGEHKIEAIFENTDLQNLAGVISLFSSVLLTAFSIGIIKKIR